MARPIRVWKESMPPAAKGLVMLTEVGVLLSLLPD